VQSQTRRHSAPADGAGGGAGGRPGGGTDACDLLIDADLEGIRPKGLDGLAVGMDLIVRLDRQDNYRSVVCVRSDGEIVGALSAFRSVNTLVNCLEDEVGYVVRVMSIGSGSCHVRGGRADR
jgi:hypothetical protein